MRTRNRRSVAPAPELTAVMAALAACPAPALVVGADGTLLAASLGAESRLGAAAVARGRRARDLLGVGWRELELVASEGEADVVVDLAIYSPGLPREGWRLRPERVSGADGRPLAVVAYLVEPSGAAAPGRRPAGPASFDDLFAEDPRLVATKAAAARFAATRLPILLLAETGTGKDLLARAIHGASPRRQRPFVAINCGALSPQLLESELFGYAPGAFTDARREGHEGKVGAARGGTLFLDEVAEMPGPLQSLLLRVLEDGTYYRVGESVPRQADVRLICATCRDLPRMVEEGSFRQDLFYRIAGACLTLPPVRERSDVRSLVVEVLRSLAEQDRGPAPRLSAEALDWMAAQRWPGNVRQIKTALQYGATLAEGAEIRCEHLPPMLVHRPAALAHPVADEPAAAAAVPAPASPVAAPGAPRGTLAALERELVQQTLAATGGNLALAARRLGIARSTLYRQIRRMEAGGLEVPAS